MRNSTYPYFNLNPNEYSEQFHYYPISVKLDRCAGSFNTRNDLSNYVCIRNKTEGFNLSVFNMITEINDSKTLTNHISCECKCKFDGTKNHLNQCWNNDKCQCDCKKFMYMKQIMFGILMPAIVKMENVYQVLRMIQ